MQCVALLYLRIVKNPKLISRLDSIGMTASALCAIHCAIVPLVFTSLPLLGLGFLANPWIEWGMIILAFIIGISSISLSYIRTHRRVLPMALLTAGFIIIICGHLYISGWIEGIIVPLGGLTIVGAHFINYKYAGSGNSCAHEGDFKHAENQVLNETGK